MATIQGIYAREILDSRGMPTVECTVWLDTGVTVTASVASGVSKSKYEGQEIRDNNRSWMAGQGVSTAINTIHSTLAPLLIGHDPTDQQGIDQLLIDTDGTQNKSKLGVNATLPVSIAICKAAAASLNLPLYYYIHQKYAVSETLHIPTSVFTLINGGHHGADNLDIQEFQLIPASYLAYPDTLNLGVTIFHKLEEVLIAKGAIHSVGVVGGFTPNLYNNIDAFELLVETVKATQYTFAQDLFFGVDMASNEFYEGGKYTLKDRAQGYTATDLLEYYRSLRTLYQVFLIEDPFHDDDWDSWKKITAELGETSTIVGDSFLSTNLERTQKAIAEKACNGISIKPNEVGTISETMAVINLAKQAGWQVVMSHRSGETNDDFIADLAVGAGAHYCKFGPPNRGERVAKYNRLSKIFQELSAQPG
ncbi:MAG: enolase [bacterium]|nr:enolase [bacterium]